MTGGGETQRAALRLAVARASEGQDPVRIAASIVRAVADAGGWELPGHLRAAAVDPVEALLPLRVPTGWAGPWLLGELYEAALAPEVRAAGAHYTPADLATRLVALVAPSGRTAVRARVWDPACGGGVFLLAAAEALVAAGGAPQRIVAEQLWGTDIDPGAVAVCEAALCWWGSKHGTDVGPGPHLGVGDALLGHDEGGPLEVAEASGFSLVVGNPPFQGQLARRSVRSATITASLRERWGKDLVRPYTDTASLFLVAGARALAPDGRMLLILPTSVLAARDAEPARAAVASRAELHGLWMAGEAVFGAAVDVCAVLLRRRVSKDGDDRDGAVVQCWHGPRVTELPRATRRSIAHLTGPAGGAEVWAGHALAALGVPDPPVRSNGWLGSIISARAGFRDEYYGLVGQVAEAPESPLGTGPDRLPEGLAPLITSGLIEPGRCVWGERGASFARQRFERPAVDLRALAAVGGRASAWVRSTAVPKVVVASQTRVGEAAVDPTGRWVASTPTIAVLADPDRLWAIAAVICSPVGSIAALAATAGAARGGAAIRQSVASITGLPLPVDGEAWAAGGEALRLQDRKGFLVAMAAAYGLVDSSEVDDWWSARTPWRAGEG